MNNSWHRYFLDIGEVVASRSKDPSTQVGAVIVNPESKAILSTGYNGFPRGVNDDLKERWERPLKYEWVLHAEVNALLNAARQGVKTEGMTLYVTPLAPCFQCSKAMINAGIKRIIFSQKIVRPEWEEEFKKSRVLFAEVDIKLLSYNNETDNLESYAK